MSAFIVGSGLVDKRCDNKQGGFVNRQPLLCVDPNRKRTQRVVLQCRSVEWTASMCLLSVAGCGIMSERSTKLGNALSGPVSAMLIGAVISNLGLIPTSHHTIYRMIQSTSVLLATPLLLLKANLFCLFNPKSSSKSSTKSLFLAFSLGAISTVLGGLLGFLVTNSIFRPFPSTTTVSPSLLSAIIAKNIGGGINYIAVSHALQVPDTLISRGIAIDNLCGLIYFPLLSFLADKVHVNGSTEKELHKNPIHQSQSAPIDALDAIFCVLLTLCVGYISRMISVSYAMVIATGLTTILASFGSKFLTKLQTPAELMGSILIYMYFAAAGVLGGSLNQILNWNLCGALFINCVVLYASHGLVLYGVAVKLLKLDKQNVILASNANIGGPQTAAALANSKGWKDKVLVSMLVGHFGNAIASFLALFAHRLLLFMQ